MISLRFVFFENLEMPFPLAICVPTVLFPIALRSHVAFSFHEDKLAGVDRHALCVCNLNGHFPLQ